MLSFSVAGTTDPGGSNKTNQDDFFIWHHPKEPGCSMLGMLDGHGCEVGHIASQTATKSFLDQLSKDETFADLRRDPKRTFDAMFATAHEAIREAFRKHYESNGWQVSDAKEGYLLKSGKSNSDNSCVHGGTTVTLIAILDGVRLLIANVGDSTGLIAGLQLFDSNLQVVAITEEKSGATSGSETVSSEAAKPPSPPATADATAVAVAGAGAGAGADADADADAELDVDAESSPPDYVLITADHSPESPDEMYRIRKFRPCPYDSSRPELLMVYDSPSYSKVDCPDVFTIHDDGTCKVNDCGKYYKNVRHEWASLVTTPANAAFQDALAFTRSLGDFHLQTYGVTTEPDVFSMDLTPAFSNAEASTVGALALCTDGVWDNWKYEDVGKYLMNPERVEAARASQEALQKVTDDFMAQNLVYGKQNFGSQADNMTAIVCYITLPS